MICLLEATCLKNLSTFERSIVCLRVGVAAVAGEHYVTVAPESDLGEPKRSIRKMQKSAIPNA
jgi:hypothetical protein